MYENKGLIAFWFARSSFEGSFVSLALSRADDCRVQATVSVTWALDGSGAREGCCIWGGLGAVWRSINTYPELLISFAANVARVQNARMKATPRLTAAVRTLCVTGLVLLGGIICSCHTGNVEDLNFFSAATRGDVAEVRTLLKRNPSLVFRKGKGGWTALHWAVSRDHTDVVDVLIANGAEINAKADDGYTPLHEAAFHGYRDVVRLLIEKKASIDAKDRNGSTPMYAATAQNHLDVVQLLLANKSDVNAGGPEGSSALDAAALFGREDIARLLLDSGANVNQIDSKGVTPLYWAKRNGHKNVEDLLRQHGGMELHPRREWPYP